MISSHVSLPLFHRHSDPAIDSARQWPRLLDYCFPWFSTLEQRNVLGWSKDATQSRLRPPPGWLPGVYIPPRSRLGQVQPKIRCCLHRAACPLEDAQGITTKCEYSCVCCCPHPLPTPTCIPRYCTPLLVGHSVPMSQCLLLSLPYPNHTPSASLSLQFHYLSYNTFYPDKTLHFVHQTSPFCNDHRSTSTRYI